MKRRCLDPREDSFKDYGARGITVCDRWRDSFAAFLADMGPRPKGTSLDRYPNKYGNYEPGNCRWATAIEQARNHGRNRLVTAHGQTKCVTEWATLLGIHPSTLTERLDKGWSPEQAVDTPAMTIATRAKLTDDDLIDIRSLLAFGATRTTLAGSFGISTSYVGRIVSGERRA